MRGPNPLKKFNNLGVITVPYGGTTTQEKFHPGVDIANAEGTPIHAPVDGIVTNVDESHLGKDNSFGNTVELKDMSGNLHQFHHLQRVITKPGQQVRKGRPIATMGQTGAVYSPSGNEPTNLDYRIVSSYGRYKNPMIYIKNL